jgi:NTE family protein
VRPIEANGASNPEIGLVLAGGGARGAYEVGVLSVLLPYLEARGERPGIIVGTSIGALNGAYLAATANLPASASIAGGVELWRKVRYRDIIDPLLSAGELGRVLRYLGELTGVPGAEVESLLDNSPMQRTVPDLIRFSQLRRNVEEGALSSVAVAATSYATGESVIFHHSREGVAPPVDRRRAIRYEATRLTDRHVRASAAIPVFFPAVEVTEPAGTAGWYGDGGTRLNTPIKPALKLGARKVVVIGLNSSVTPDDPTPDRPDVFDGAAQLVQALLADQLAQDVATLAAHNEDLAGRSGGEREPIPYVFLAPRDRFDVGQLASDVYRREFGGLRAKLESRDLAALGHIVAAGRNAVRGDLFSFLFFDESFTGALLDRGQADAKRLLEAVGDGDPWRCVPERRDAGPARPSELLSHGGA